MLRPHSIPHASVAKDSDMQLCVIDVVENGVYACIPSILVYIEVI